MQSLSCGIEGARMMPENSGRKPVLYMMVDGQPVEVEPDFAEITFTEDQQGNKIGRASCRERV